MRIAALIQAHHRPDLLERLLKRLRGPLWSRHVHVDRKFRGLLDADCLARADFPVSSVVDVRWGGMTQVQATLHLLGQAVRDTGNTHFFLMSGQCFPVKSDREIEARLAAGTGNLIEVVPIPAVHIPIERLSRYHFNDYRWFSDLNDTRIKRLQLRLTRRLPRRDVDRLLHGLRPFGGANWWVLNRRTVEAMLEFIAVNPWYAAAFRFAQCPDEMFFQTLVVRTGQLFDNEDPTFAKWEGSNSGPSIMTEALLAEARASSFLFARKFDRIDLLPTD